MTTRMTAVFDVLRDWCIEQFSALGLEERASDYALDLLARMQGVILIANVYNDREFLHRSIGELTDWIKQLTSH